ncbi:hypothetical protein [Citrobacter werkmanii]|uniref:hypothetical protein n=1 Tax=Citrobacter werkmanii TaxID=67827 RepID=UPI0037C6C592
MADNDDRIPFPENPTWEHFQFTNGHAANSFSDDDLRSMIVGKNNPKDNAYRELLAYRQAASRPYAWVFEHPNGKLFNSLVDESCSDHESVVPVFSAPQLPGVGYDHRAEKLKRLSGQYVKLPAGSQFTFEDFMYGVRQAEPFKGETLADNLPDAMITLLHMAFDVLPKEGGDQDA